MNESGDIGSDVAAVRLLQERLVDAYNRQDLDELMSHMHPDVAYLVPSRPAVEGWESVRRMYDEVFTRFRESGFCIQLHATTDDELVVSGDWAWACGDTHALRTPIGEASVVPSGALPGSKHLSIYRRENGRWLRYRQMRNGNTPEMNF